VTTEKATPVIEPAPGTRGTVRDWLAGLHHPSSSEVKSIDEMSSNELAEMRTELATQRTVMAADRSLMAWVRTALSMISFGFTIYKLLQGFEQKGADLGDASSPRVMGLFLTGLGTVAMVMGLLEYWHRVKSLHGARRVRVLQPSFVMALIMSATGLFLFIGIISKLL
jgi:putative membrane protein